MSASVLFHLSPEDALGSHSLYLRARKYQQEEQNNKYDHLNNVRLHYFPALKS